MSLSAMKVDTDLSLPGDVKDCLRSIAGDVAAGRLIPYLGPRILGAPDGSVVPTTAEALALALHQRVPVGARLKGNMWGTAQFIEQRRHRKTLVAFMSDIFKTTVEPGPLHAWLAGLKVPMIVDTWYDAALSRAFREAGRPDFAEIQGITRALEYRDVWTKSYSADGREISEDEAGKAATVIYKPHGSVAPAQNFLVADSDYVEVLTEIDIQTPIPEIVKQRRSDRGFLFLGCRFDDQMLRTYARQLMKRSGGARKIVVDFEPTRMEERFFEEQGIEPLYLDLDKAVEIIVNS